MTTNTEALDELCGLVNRTATETRARLLKRLNQTIRGLERGPVKPWFLETEVSGSPVLVASQGYIDLPTDFLEEYEDGAFRIQDTVEGAWTDPDKVEVEQLETGGDDLSAALPTGYAIYGDKILLRAVPDLAYPYKFKYYGRTDPIVEDTDDITNKWLLEFYDLVLYQTAVYAASSFLRAPEIVRDLAPILKMEKDNFLRAVESRKHANMDYLLGNRED